MHVAFHSPRAAPGSRAPFRAAAAGAIVLALLILAQLAAVQPALAQRGQIAPEAATGSSERAALATAGRYMVAAANRHAVEAGLEILAAGGSAADAAIAVQLVLGLVEPQSSGLGGGAFLITWDAGRGQLKTYDGRETAPAAARPDRFLADGKPVAFDAAVSSGLSVGVPGVVRLLASVHRTHGRLPWPRLFEPAIRLARQGFAVSPRLHFLLRWQGADSFAPTARTYFFDGSNARAIGANLTNPAYAATLGQLAGEGPDAFYAGPIADAVVAAVKSAPGRAGGLALADLASYAIVEREPLCITYRRHRVCGMGPPSSGGLAVAQALKLLEPFDLGTGPRSAMNPRAMHLIAEALKLAFADRDRYVADPSFVPLVDGLLEPVYLDERRRRIDPTRAMPRPAAGVPPARVGALPGEDDTHESTGTSHLSIVDGQGNAVSMTTTIEGAFGSRLWAAGFLLNNQLTDFSFRPVDGQGRPIANRVEPGKRPRSSMAPTVVLDETGRLKAVLGSPGGSRIILYVLKTLVAIIDWQVDAQRAVALANFGSRGDAFEIENDPAMSWETLARPWISRPSLWHALNMTAFGHRIAPDFLTSGLHVIVRHGDRLEGGADPRREGIAKGH